VPTPAELVKALQEGDRRAASRLITLVEARTPEGLEALRLLYPLTGRAQVIGITGPPGSGKSTLTDKLIGYYRTEGKRVGVVAIDPSSPFTGGALLGDRIRMQSRSTDKQVFIRSMGSRGALGGLSRSAPDAVKVLDAFGCDVILIETVGVGQGEIDIVRTADTVLVVAVPGLGDEVQNIKAGIMEIGDVFCVNKADRDDAGKTVAELETWLAFVDTHALGWTPPVVKTIAERGDGVADLAKALASHREWMQQTGRFEARRRERGEHEVLETLRYRITEAALTDPVLKESFRELTARVGAREVDPYTAAEELFERWRKAHA